MNLDHTKVMSAYNYNSNHKVVTAFIILVGITMFHFLRKEEIENDKIYENGQIKFHGGKQNEINHGVWTWYFPNGSKMIEGKFDHGKREGIWKQFYSNGQIQMTSSYHENHLEGILTTYDTLGLPQKSFEYRMDTIYKELTIY